jgi:hypothetical protein
MYSKPGAELERLLDIHGRRAESLFPEYDWETLRPAMADAMAYTAFYADFPPESPEFEFIFDAGVGTAQMDEVADGETQNGIDTSPKLAYKHYRTWKRLREGDVEAFETLGLHYPPLALGTSYMAATTITTQKLIPDAKKKLVHIVPMIVDSMLAVFFAKTGGKFSESTLTYLRGLTYAAETTLETIAGFSGAVLEEKVRECCLFKVLVMAFRNGIGLYNDILGLPKDIRQSETNETSVLRRVVGEGLSLAEALSATLRVLNEQTQDIREASRIMMETFPEDTNLAEYIRLLQSAYTGHLYWYVISLRYSKVQYSLRPNPVSKKK